MNNLEYGKNAQLESDGINFMDYAPESKSVLKISRESLNGTENQFSWGQAVRAEYIEDIEKNENVWSRQKGYTRIKGGRAFVLYLKNYRTVCIGRSAAEENPKDIPKVSTRCKDTGRCLLCKD